MCGTVPDLPGTGPDQYSAEGWRGWWGWWSRRGWWDGRGRWGGLSGYRLSVGGLSGHGLCAYGLCAYGLSGYGRVVRAMAFAIFSASRDSSRSMPLMGLVKPVK